MNFNATLIGQSISFAVFVWFCMKFVWPALMKALDERQKRIADGLAAGERGRHELELGETRAKEVLKGAKQQTQELLASAQKRADEIIEEAKAVARIEGERLIVAARAEIEQQSIQAREDLRKQVGVLAVTGAEQILMREVNPAAHKDMLDRLAASL